MDKCNDIPPTCPLLPYDFEEVYEIPLSIGCTHQYFQVRQNLVQPLCMTEKKKKFKSINIHLYVHMETYLSIEIN
jgi:hypothetical protein